SQIKLGRDPAHPIDLGGAEVVIDKAADGEVVAHLPRAGRGRQGCVADGTGVPGASLYGRANMDGNPNIYCGLVHGGEPLLCPVIDSVHVVLLNVGQGEGGPAGVSTSGGNLYGGHGAVGALVVVHAEDELLEVVDAPRAVGPLADLLHCRHEQGDEYSNDGD